MALIKCKECGKEMSDQAESCPNCGYKLKNKTIKTKKTGAIIVLIASSIFVILSLLLLLAEFTPTQSNPEYSNSTNGITIGELQQSEVLSQDVRKWVNRIFFICPIILTILSIVYLSKYKPTKKIYGMVSLILSVIWLATVAIFISKETLGCCYIIFLINPILSLVGSILTLIELLGEKNNEIKTTNE